MRISDWSSDVCSSDLNQRTKTKQCENPRYPDPDQDFLLLSIRGFLELEHKAAPALLLAGIDCIQAPLLHQKQNVDQRPEHDGKEHGPDPHPAGPFAHQPGMNQAGGGLGCQKNRQHKSEEPKAELKPT